MNLLKRKNNVITYTVSKEKQYDQMYISVQNGEVVVTAPTYFSSRQIQEVIDEKKAWILKKIREYESKNVSLKSDRKQVKILGKNYEIKISYKNIKVAELNVKDNELDVYLPNRYKKVGNKEILDLAIRKMYEQLAKEEIEMVMEKTRVLLNGLAPEDYEIKEINGHLAKCSSDKKITINPEIVKYDKEIIEYIIFCQFCNLKHRTNSKAFINMVNKYFPNYRQIEARIK